MTTKQNRILLSAVLIAALVACAKKKKADEFQNFTGVSYNAAPKTLAAGLGLNIAVQPIDINFDGKMDGLYVCRTGGIKQDMTPISTPVFTPTGAGYTNSPNVIFTALSCTTYPRAHAVVANGRVERVVMLDPGVGCTGNTVSFTNPPGQPGANASATPTVTAGKVTRVTMTNKGAGYLAPTVTIAGAGGTGATAGVNIGHDATGASANSGQITGIYLLTPGDGRYSSASAIPLTADFSGDTGTATTYTIPAANIIDTELDANGGCSVTYDPTNANPNLRHIPQMLFTWPVTPTVGLDTNGDTNADYYLYTNTDGSAQVMTNADGSGAVAKLIVKNPAIDESIDWLYNKLSFGQVIGFDVLDNNSIANNILGKIALDREDPAYVDGSDPVPIISPIRNGLFYAAPMDVNILCSDKVACNAIAYTLKLGITPTDTPNFGNTNLDLTGVDYTGTKHSIRPGDSSTLSFQNLPFGNYTLNYKVRDAAGRESALQTINFTIGRKPDIFITGVSNRNLSGCAGTGPATGSPPCTAPSAGGSYTQGTIQWTADTASPTKMFRYVVIANGSCVGYSRLDYFSGAGALDYGGPFPSGTPITSIIRATGNGMDASSMTSGVNLVSICAISCSGACSGIGNLEVVGESTETILRDDTAPTVTAVPSSGIFPDPQQIWLSGSVTTGLVGLFFNGLMAPTEICYTWGANGAGNPQAGTVPANPSFPCPTANNVVGVSGSEARFNVGCPTRASVTDLSTDLTTCSPVPGIYYIKYIARDAAGNQTAVMTQAYAVAINPQITTIDPPQEHVWGVVNTWGHQSAAATTANPITAAGTSLRATTIWRWQADFPGTYQILINDLTVDCTGGTPSSHASWTGPVTALTPINVTLQASDMTIGINSVKVCFWPSGGGPVTSVSRSVWNLAPLDISTTYAKVNFNVGETITLSLADIFTPVNAIREIKFACPAGSTGVDANNGCTQPTASGTTLRAQSGIGTVEVNSAYTIPSLPANRVTTIVYDVTVALCNTSSCSAASGPQFGTEAAAPYSASGTLKFYILKNKTVGQAIYVSNAGSDANAGTSRALPKRTLSAGMTAAGTNKAVYITSGSYCGVQLVSPPNPFLTACTGLGGGTLSIPSNTSVYGGFSPQWYRPDVGASNTLNIDVGIDNLADSSGIAIGNVTAPVDIEGLTVNMRRVTAGGTQGYNAIGISSASVTSTLSLYKNNITTLGRNTTATDTQPGGTYGIRLIAGGGSNLILTGNTVTVGGGWNGKAGGALGATGATPGTGGSGGNPGVDTGCTFSCGGVAGGAGGAGGPAGQPGVNAGGAGGQGGDSKGNAAGGGGTGGNGGGSGGGGGGQGGTPGGCAQPSGQGGGNGNPGGGVGGGSNGAAAGAAYGQITANLVVGYKGNNGTDGADGRGGGGGGGGRGSAACEEASGGGGGGGGGGGALGQRGEGGWYGGSSVGILLINAANITMTNNTITRKHGGNGGNGQGGGNGGSGRGGAGGGPGGDSDTGGGGTGGAGSAGGDGGDGSGGNGGPSFGLVIFPNITPTCAANTHSALTGDGFGTGSAGGGPVPGSAGLNRQCAIFPTVTPGSLTACPAACGGTGP